MHRRRAASPVGPGPFDFHTSRQMLQLVQRALGLFDPAALRQAALLKDLSGLIAAECDEAMLGA